MILTTIVVQIIAEQDLSGCPGIARIGLIVAGRTMWPGGPWAYNKLLRTCVLDALVENVHQDLRGSNAGTPTRSMCACTTGRQAGREGGSTRSIDPLAELLHTGAEFESSVRTEIVSIVAKAHSVVF